MEERKSYTATLLLSFFLGILGIHRFYTGYIGLGIIQLLTLGGCGLWTLIDFISICFNNYKEANGQELEDYNKVLGQVFFWFWLVLTVLAFISNAATFTQLMTH